MNCPDCKVELEEHTHTVGYQETDGSQVELLEESHYYKCPICRVEFDAESLGDDNG